MRLLYFCSILLLLTQCSVNEAQEEFIKQLTDNNWFVPNSSNPSIPSATPMVFNNDGSFTDVFTDLDGVNHNIVYTIHRVLDSSFAYYLFELSVDGEIVNLERGVGIGFNTTLRPVVFQGQFKEESTPPSAGAPTEQKIEWYEKTYTLNNYVQHAGNSEDTIAVR